MSQEENTVFRTVIQRVSSAELCIDGQSMGKICKGLVVLFAVGQRALLAEDQKKDLKPVLEKLADKILNLRVFSDESGKMNLSVKDIFGGVYVVSQFTLFADLKKGNRPSFVQSAPPSVAQPLYDLFLNIVKERAENLICCHGVFGAEMQVTLCNDGPVTLILDASF